MNIIINKKNKNYKVGEILPENLIKGSNKKLILASCTNKNDGEDAIICADEYLIGYRKYSLGKNYGIQAKINGNLIAPVAREPFGKELIIKEAFQSGMWPKIIRIAESEIQDNNFTVDEDPKYFEDDEEKDYE